MTAQNNTGNDSAAEPTLFSAIITPHRSLSGKGFIAVMALVGGLSFAGGMFFFLMGAWPVIGFLGLDVLLVYWAFRANYRAAAAFDVEGVHGAPACVMVGSPVSPATTGSTASSGSSIPASSGRCAGSC